MEYGDGLPELKEFPLRFAQYEWDSLHAAFGWPPDCFDTGFPWIVDLEDRFRAAMEQNGFPPLSLVTEMILWGGNQQNRILKTFSANLRSVDFAALMRDVVDNLDTPHWALRSAEAMPGFGLTYGSKLLRFCRPEVYGALDSRIQTALSNRSGAVAIRKSGSTCIGYTEFLRLLRQFQWDLHDSEIARPEYHSRPADTLWTAAEVEMALFAWASSQS